MKVGVSSAAALLVGIVFGGIFPQSPAAERKLKRKSPPAAQSEPKHDDALQPNADGKIVMTNTEWQKRLTKLQFRVARRKGTEPPFQNAYWNSQKDGVYQCVCCKLELFDSQAKFDSGTGWPSFWQPVEKDAVAYQIDRTEAEPRREVLCRRCDAHLGHVFADGPPPTGQRYCMNSASLKFVGRPKNGKRGHAGSERPKR